MLRKLCWLLLAFLVVVFVAQVRQEHQRKESEAENRRIWERMKGRKLE